MKYGQEKAATSATSVTGVNVEMTVQVSKKMINMFVVFRVQPQICKSNNKEPVDVSDTQTLVSSEEEQPCLKQVYIKQARLCLQRWMHSLTFVPLSITANVMFANPHTHTSIAWTRSKLDLQGHAIQCRDSSRPFLSPYCPMRRVIPIHRAKGSGEGRQTDWFDKCLLLTRIQMSLQEIAANNSSLQLQNAGHDQVVTSLSHLVWRTLITVIKQFIH